jgi:hypothetical protein
MRIVVSMPIVALAITNHLLHETASRDRINEHYAVNAFSC